MTQQVESEEGSCAPFDPVSNNKRHTQTLSVGYKYVMLTVSVTAFCCVVAQELHIVECLHSMFTLPLFGSMAM